MKLLSLKIKIWLQQLKLVNTSRKTDNVHQIIEYNKIIIYIRLYLKQKNLMLHPSDPSDAIIAHCRLAKTCL